MDMLPDVRRDHVTDACLRMGLKKVSQLFEKAADSFSNSDEVAQGWYRLWLTRGFGAFPEQHPLRKYVLGACNLEDDLFIVGMKHDT